MKTKLAKLWKIVCENKLISVMSIATIAVAVAVVSIFIGKVSKGGILKREPAVAPVISIEVEDLVGATDAFLECDVTVTSSEKDLKIFFTDMTAESNRISGVPFKVKLIDPVKSAELIAYILDINAIDEELDKLSDSERAKSPLNLKKTELLEAYSKALEAMDGTNLTDDNMDGEIYEKDVKPGEYTLCFYPVKNYVAKDYTTLATVRDKVEYKVVNNIKKTFKVYTETEDIPVKKVESLKNTVEYVESSTGIKGVASTPKVDSKQVTVSVPDAKKVTISLAKLSSSSGSGDTNSGGSGSGDTNSGGSGSGDSNSSGSGSGDSNSSDNGSDGNSNSNTTPTASVIVPNRVYLTSSNGDSKSFDVNVSVAKQSATEKNAAFKAVTTCSSGSGTVTIDSVTVDGAAQSSEGFTLDIGAHTVGVNFTVNLTEGADTYKGTGSESFAITVEGPDNSGKLVDANGVQLYKDEACTQAATVADYKANSSATYYKQETKYLGWQTINGVQYYYDKNGNKVTGSQVINGVMYNFGSDGAKVESGTGIDVSKWQGTIDWSKVKGNVTFAIMRCGFRATGSGAIIEDPKYREYMKGAKANGIPTGVYFYSTALNEAEAVEEASAAVALVQEMGGCSLPIYIDMEDNVRGQHKLTNAQRTAICQAFCQVVRSAGYTPGVYASHSWLTQSINSSQFGNDIKIWVAQYRSSCTYKGRYDIWQYGTGTVPGINGKVDMNIMY